MEKLLTQSDLAKRWQVDKATIKNWRDEGILTPCKGIPAIRFTEQYVSELEGIKLEKFSPIERRRMEHELEALKKENEELKRIISTVLAATSKAINFQGGQPCN